MLDSIKRFLKPQTHFATISASNLIGLNPDRYYLDGNFEYEKRYGVIYQEEMGFQLSDGVVKNTYTIFFNTPENMEKYGRDSLDKHYLISYSINLDRIPDYLRGYITLIEMGERCIYLYVDKKEYEMYIRKEIPFDVAFPSSAYKESRRKELLRLYSCTRLV